eukprot:TRINITY_DN11624_c0_g1_i1.p1 TRINITY_DN11624_c0_g1~~TRINITY_DN11624_c0_g1_i1.p1  ORF type:complete len:528 (+),score=60.57 TRINITY_DN11624_c0_g1_i1:128-1711(+)
MNFKQCNHPERDTVMTILFAMALVAQIVASCCRVSWTELCFWLRQSSAALPIFGSSSEEQSGWKKALPARFERLRMTQRRIFTRVAECVLVACCIQIIQNTVFKCNSRYFDFGHHVLVVVGSLISCTSNIISHCRVTYLKGISFELSMIWLAAFAVASVMKPETNTSALFCARIARVYASAVALDIRKAISWNCVFSGIFVACAKIGDNSNLQTHVLEEVILLVVVIGGAVAFANHATESLAQKLTLEAANVAHTAVYSLLEQICDFIVELDSDLSIKGPASKLEAALLLNPQRSLQGGKFSLLLFEEAEREEFERKLSLSSSADKDLILHTSMRDSVGNSVKIEVFVVTYTDICEERCYLLGLREYTDVDSVTKASHATTRIKNKPYSNSDEPPFEHSVSKVAGSRGNRGSVTNARPQVTMGSSSLPHTLIGNTDNDSDASSSRSSSSRSSSSSRRKHMSNPTRRRLSITEVMNSLNYRCHNCGVLVSYYLPEGGQCESCNMCGRNSHIRSSSEQKDQCADGSLRL